MAKIGHIPWNKGIKGIKVPCAGWNRGLTYKASWDTSYLLGNQNAKGHTPNETSFKKGIIPWNKGTKGVMKAWNKGIPMTEEQRRVNSLSHLGKPAPHNAGEKSHFWKGGICREQYTEEWTWALRSAVRKRDDFTCRICGKKPSKIVHHIDYNKANCEMDNLVTVCKRDHSLTTMNRQHWLAFFKNSDMMPMFSNKIKEIEDDY